MMPLASTCFLAFTAGWGPLWSLVAAHPDRSDGGARLHFIPVTAIFVGDVCGKAQEALTFLYRGLPRLSYWDHLVVARRDESGS